jgi:ATP/maltotriose-dependent transcriptional regulator MalT
MPAYLRRQDLFVVETAGDTLRYHHIFHDFLRLQATPEQHRAWNQLAGGYFRSNNDPESAIYHLLEAHHWTEVADLLDTFAASLLTSGRLDMLATYLDALPKSATTSCPIFHFGS